MIINHPRVKVCSSGEEAELLIPPHLDLEAYPGWLRKQALERNPEYKDAWPNSESDAVSALIASIDAWDWLDHWGTAIYAGKEHLVSEPYHMNRERIDQLLRFCNEFNLAVNIQASGHHYPTKTMRIFVWPKEWTNGRPFPPRERRLQGRTSVGRALLRGIRQALPPSDPPPHSERCQGCPRSKRRVCPGKTSQGLSCGKPKRLGKWHDAMACRARSKGSGIQSQ